MRHVSRPVNTRVIHFLMESRASATDSYGNRRAADVSSLQYCCECSQPEL